MANIVIVSNNCYLLCESINSIHIDARTDNNFLEKEDPLSLARIINNLKSNKGRKKKPPKKKVLSAEEYRRKLDATNSYQITINYNPVQKGQNNNSDEEKFVQFTVIGLDRAMIAYRELVKQVREQIPDQVFLNELVDRLLEEAADDSKDTDKLHKA